jgi:hypothetical protein
MCDPKHLTTLGLLWGICKVNTFFQSYSYYFLYNAKNILPPPSIKFTLTSGIPFEIGNSLTETFWDFNSI